MDLNIPPEGVTCDKKFRCNVITYETVPIRIRTISSPSEGGRKSQRENYQALAMKGERHSMFGTESNPGCSQDLNWGGSSEVWMCYHDATKDKLKFEDNIKNNFPRLSLILTFCNVANLSLASFHPDKLNLRLLLQTDNLG